MKLKAWRAIEAEAGVVKMCKNLCKKINESEIGVGTPAVEQPGLFHFSRDGIGGNGDEKDEKDHLVPKMSGKISVR